MAEKKYKLEDFWNFLYSDVKVLNKKLYHQNKLQDVFVEVRLINTELDRSIKIPNNWYSSYYINSYEELKLLRDKYKTNVYISTQLKRKIYTKSKKDDRIFLGYTTKTEAVRILNKIFIDFDLKDKSKSADAYRDLVDKFIIHIEKKIGFKLSYEINFSGNGLHLFLKFNPYMINLKYNMSNNNIIYNIDSEYMKDKNMIKNFGKFLKKEYAKIDTDIFDLDNKVFEIARITRCPMAINEKNGIKKITRILDIRKNKEGEEKLRELLLKDYRDMKIELKPAVITSTNNNLKSEDLLLHPFITLLTSHLLPEGNRNLYLERNFCALLKQSNVQLEDENITNIIETVERVQGQSFLSWWDKLDEFENVTYNENEINSWCIDNNIKPIHNLLVIYPVIMNRKKFSQHYNTKRLIDIHVERILDFENAPKRIRDIIKEKDFTFKNIKILYGWCLWILFEQTPEKIYNINYIFSFFKSIVGDEFYKKYDKLGVWIELFNKYIIYSNELINSWN